MTKTKDKRGHMSYVMDGVAKYGLVELVFIWITPGLSTRKWKIGINYKHLKEKQNVCVFDMISNVT